MIARHIQVKGRVQGVGLRAFVEGVAAELGVRGEVWNARGGSVEIHIEHESQGLLDEFQERLIRGPGHIDSTKISIADPNGCMSFVIGSSR